MRNHIKILLAGNTKSQDIRNTCSKEGFSTNGPQCTIGLVCRHGRLEMKHCTGGLIWNNEMAACHVMTKSDKCFLGTKLFVLFTSCFASEDAAKL